MIMTQLSPADTQQGRIEERDAGVVQSKAIPAVSLGSGITSQVAIFKIKSFSVPRKGQKHCFSVIIALCWKADQLPCRQKQAKTALIREKQIHLTFLGLTLY